METNSGVFFFFPFEVCTKLKVKCEVVPQKEEGRWKELAPE